MLNAAQERALGRPWVQTPTAALALAGSAAALLGIAVAVAASPLYVIAGLLGFALLVAIFARPVLGLFAFVLVVATLPFGVIPVRVGVQFTFVDVVLIAVFLSFLVRLPARLTREDGFTLGTPGALLLVFIGVAIVAFLAGSGAVSVAPDQARKTAKLIASLLLFVVATNLLLRPGVVFWLTRALMAGGALMGGVGAVLWLLPQGTQLRLLTALARVGYPTGDVLRFVPGPNNTYTTQLRAIGTSVDPNVFGGTLMLAMALIVVQFVSAGRLFPRPLLLLLAVPTLAGLVLSFSRGSWTGLAVAVLLVGRRSKLVWLAAILAVAALVASPAGQTLLDRYLGGFSVSDPATAFRLGEYQNALTILQRYPLLGIGFGSSPDIDVTAGVSSVYLLVAEQTGLLGLAAYLAAIVAVLRAGTRGVSNPTDPRLGAVRAAAMAAMVGALVAGTVDHYFANQAFPHAVALFWLYAALLVASARLIRHSAEPTRQVDLP